MELQLGLALPSVSTKGFDLNCRIHEPVGAVGSDPWMNTRAGSCLAAEKKRSFDEAFGQSIALSPSALPLLLWIEQPNGEDNDDPFRIGNKNPFPFKHKNGGDGVVGWPPVKSWRKKGTGTGGGGGSGGGGGGGTKSMYVKVNMEGVGLTRKVDLSLHHSYQTLKATLVGMFGKYEDDDHRFKLAYQDREGDWLLAGDVPWRTFMRSVQRLKLLKCNG
ncbi:auxin-responsive protein IAA20-like isoform X2 [Malania oleifera]|uniref:auxin-responsive protein IAA20-like isoform X2 n=1 Tax=Malania oleifera TaxID=397392 RepID=UPI0025AEC91A|nr:auxin-responsive protein IAA20-like isoform X2 [Malania oleifera]